jgi:hypothetical protein
MPWLPRELRNASGDTAIKPRVLLAFSIGTFFSTLLFGVVFLYISSTFLGVMVIFLAMPMGGAALVLRWSGSFPLAAYMYLCSIWLLIATVSTVLGGIRSPAFPAYSLVILGATFMLGRRAGVWWTCVIAASMMLSELLQGYVLHVPISPEAVPFFNWLAYSAVLVEVCIFAFYYDRAKTSALEEVRGANLRIAQMIGQLEQASDRLILSSERFLGRDPQGGLIGRMMRKARSGHSALEQSRTSVSGMIDQYRRIGERVQTLHRYSQLIVELVSTIDRISDRLDMIALNVGIEASRSGEAGKQFTILAGDMRGLAERVLSETRQIKGALHNVHEQIQQVLESSASGQVLTEESASKISDMARTFDEIHALVEETETAAGQITEDTLAQIAAVRRLISVAARAEA